MEQFPLHIPITDDESADDTVGAPPPPTAALTTAPATTTESLAEISVTATATTTPAVHSLIAIRGTSRGGLRRFIRKSTGIAGTLKKSWGQGLARSREERATKPNGGTTSAHARRSLRLSVGVGPIQLDRVPTRFSPGPT